MGIRGVQTVKILEVKDIRGDVENYEYLGNELAIEHWVAWCKLPTQLKPPDLLELRDRQYKVTAIPLAHILSMTIRDPMGSIGDAVISE